MAGLEGQIEKLNFASDFIAFAHRSKEGKIKSLYESEQIMKLHLIKNHILGASNVQQFISSFFDSIWFDNTQIHTHKFNQLVPIMNNILRLVRMHRHRELHRTLVMTQLK